MHTKQEDLANSKKTAKKHVYDVAHLWIPFINQTFNTDLINIMIYPFLEDGRWEMCVYVLGLGEGKKVKSSTSLVGSQ